MCWRNLFEASRFYNSFVRTVSTAKQFQILAGSFDVETNFTNYELPLPKNSIDRHSDQRFNISAAKSRSNRIKSCSFAIDRITGLFCVGTRSIFPYLVFDFTDWLVRSLISGRVGQPRNRRARATFIKS